MVTYTITSTADFDACYKVKINNSNSIESISDNAYVTDGTVKLLNFTSDTFFLDDAPNVSNSKWNTGNPFVARNLGTYSTEITGGKLQTYAQIPVGGDGTGSQWGLVSKDTKLLHGDFDIQIDLDSETIIGLNSGVFFGVSKAINDAITNFAMIGFFKNTLDTLSQYEWGGGIVSNTTLTTPTKFRITRVTTGGVYTIKTYNNENK